MSLVGYRYSPPDPPGYPTPGTPLRHCPSYTTGTRAVPARLKEAVGLRSVGQLTLSARISGFQGITEGYNLPNTGNPNDHKSIPGNE